METQTFLLTTTFFPPYHIGGDATHVYHLSCELAKRGHDVHIIHLMNAYSWQRKGEPEATQYPLPENVVVHPLQSSIGKLAPALSYISGIPLSLRRDIEAILKDVKPDVLHHHNIAGFGPWIFGLQAPVRLYTAHDHWLICQMNGCLDYAGRMCNSSRNCIFCSVMSGRPPQLWRYSPILQKKLQNIDMIIAPSEYLKKRLTASGIHNPITVIPNFVPEPLEPGPALFKDPYFLFVGVLEKHKGILDLVNTFIELKSEIGKKLVIAGNGSEFNNIKELISREKCDDNIILLGNVSDYSILSNLYSFTEAVIVPSLVFENCPMVVLESLAHRTPVITSNMGGLPELVQRYKNCLIFNSSGEIKHIIKNYRKKFTPLTPNTLFFNYYYYDYKRIICKMNS